uniref:Transmembrane protein n=1 Tax=Arabidopsis thaliana TaxID=3702 RepID=Q8LCD0_ARATH|nr:unknown [Arabidopsis thaliana]
MRNGSPVILVFFPIRRVVILELHLVHIVGNLLGASHKLNHRTRSKTLPPFLLSFNLFCARILLLLENWIFVEKLIHFWSVPVIRYVLTLP